MKIYGALLSGLALTLSFQAAQGVTDLLECRTELEQSSSGTKFENVSTHGELSIESE